MELLRKKLIWLLHQPGATWVKVARALRDDPTLDSSDFPFFNCIPPGQADAPSFPSTPSLQGITEKLLNYEKDNISVITIFDPAYPDLLRHIFQPPLALFAKGDSNLLLREPKLAVVGSRQASQYGKNAIRLLFPALLEKGVVIVSGLAKGIDAAAHECAIRNGGKTIGVIAGGFHHIYPEENRKLANEMMKNQLVLSEYPPDTKPTRWQFPMRNRIISGLCRGTFIIEAKYKSGSLITANFAVNEGRDVFSLPGSIFNPFSVGTNELIQHGAKLVTEASDILNELYF